MPGRGLFEFNFLPFGLCNAPATFQRLIESVLADALFKYAVAYIDDIAVCWSSWEEHMMHLDTVLTRITRRGLRLKRSKCKLATTIIKFLGHIVTPQGTCPNPDKVLAITQFPTQGRNPGQGVPRHGGLLPG